MGRTRPWPAPDQRQERTSAAGPARTRRAPPVRSDAPCSVATVTAHTSTRDLLLELRAARRQSVDHVICAALTAMKRDERRPTAAAEARAIEDDPQDRAEIEAIHEDLAALQTPT